MSSSEPADDAVSTSRASKLERFALTVIMILSATLCFWGLGRQGLGFDELFTFSIAESGPINSVGAAARDISPPLYFILQSMMLMVMRPSEWTLRLLSAVSCTLTTPVLYLAGKRLIGAQVGLWAAGLYAVSRMGLWYAQEARMYALFMLLSALLLLVFALLLERPTWQRAALLTLVLVALEYTHVYGYLAAPILLLPVLALPWLRRRVGRLVAAASAAAVALLLPWVPVLLRQTDTVQTAASAGLWWIERPPNIALALLNDLAAYAPGNHVAGTATFLALLLAGTVLGFRVPRSRETQLAEGARAQREIVLSLLGFSVLPALIGLLVSRYITPVHDVRYTLGALPSAMILVANGGVNLRRPLGHIGLVALLVIGLAWLPDFHTNTNKGNWHQVAEMASTPAGNVTVLVDSWYDAYCLDTYLRMLRLPGDPTILYHTQEPIPAELTCFADERAGRLEAFTLGTDRLLVVTFGGTGVTELTAIQSSPRWRSSGVDTFDQMSVYGFYPSGH